jgi:2-keto-3-deoxy-L-rhamnonate aldolase RhmA
MRVPENRFKRALARDERQIGLWSTLGSAMVAELVGHAGFDWLLIDTEHSPTWCCPGRRTAFAGSSIWRPVARNAS